MLYPLVLQCYLRMETPIYFRGGALVTLFKGKGDATICENSRGVVVQDGLTKKLNGQIRSHLYPFFHAQARNT